MLKLKGKEIFTLLHFQYTWDIPLYISSIVWLYLKIFFTLKNSVDPDEMSDKVAFHLGLHCSGVFGLKNGNSWLFRSPKWKFLPIKFTRMFQASHTLS